MKGIRTIALRLTGTKEAAEELEEMGEDTSDMIMSQSKMRDLIMNATKVASNDYKGFDIQDELGRYKSTYEIMLGLSQIWDEIQQADFKTGDNRQNLLLESIAGKNRASIAASILQNPEILQSVYEDSSTKAAGSAIKENEKVLASITGHLAQLKNAWQEMWASASNRETINFFIDFAKGIIEAVNSVGILKAALIATFGGIALKGLTSSNSLLVKYIALLKEGGNVAQMFSNKLNMIGDKFAGAKQIGAMFSDKKEQSVKPDIDNTTDPLDVMQAAQSGANVAGLEAEKAATDGLTESTRQLNAARTEGAVATGQQASEEVLQSAFKKDDEKATRDLTNAERENANVSKQSAEADREQTSAIGAEIAAKRAGNFGTKALNKKGKRSLVDYFNNSAFNNPSEIDMNAPDFIKQFGKFNKNELKETIDNMQKLADNGEDVGAILTQAGAQGAGAFATLGSKIGEVGAGIASTLTSILTSPMFWFAAVPAAIAIGTTIYDWQKKKQQEVIDQAHETTNAWNEQKQSLEDYSQKYKDLSMQLENPNLSDQEQFEIKKQIYDIQKQITDQYGNAAKGVDLVNGKLDDQLEKIRNISVESAKSDLANDKKIFDAAKKEMTKEQTYDMQVAIGGGAGFSLNEGAKNIIDSLDSDLFELTQKQLSVTEGNAIEYDLVFKGDASQAEKALQELFNKLNAMTEDERKANGVQTLFDNVGLAIQKNNKILDKYKEDYNTFLTKSLYADNEGRGLFFEYGEAVENLNNALIIGDKKEIQDTYKAFKQLESEVNDFYATADNDKYQPVFDNIAESLNQSALNSYLYKDKMQSAEVRPVLEGIFGTATENKKVSDKVVRQVHDAADTILKEQQKAFEWGVTDEVSPIDNMFSRAQFENVNMNDRPIIEWSEKRKEQFKDALASWKYDPEIGSIDTVLGSWGTFNGIDIAFTPIIKGKNGKGELLTKDSVNEYINNLVQQSTDSNGKINKDLLLNLDKQDKKIIAEVGKGAEKVSKIMHFSGKKGAIALAYESLAKSTKETDLSTEKIMKHLKEFGSAYGVERLFKDMKYDAVDVENAIRNGGNAISDMASQFFGIDVNTPDAELQAFIGYLQELGYVTTEIGSSSSDDTEKFFQEVSGWIQEVDSLSSTLAKGQGALTFTKTLDEKGNEIESDVSKIVNAYKDLAGYDFYSLFEETTTGIMINADALRELQLQQESLRKAQLEKKRSDLMHMYANAADDPARQANLRKEIETIDMLSAAYEGATSTFSKYLAGRNSADYSTDYHMLRDQAIKDAEGYEQRHEAGDEGFKRIANMFTYQDVSEIAAEAKKAGEDGADAIYQGYKEGLNNVKPFITDDPLQGMTAWRDYLEQLPKEFGTYEWDENGFFNIEQTDEQVDKLAQRLKVSKEVVESLMKEMRSVFGYDIHFFKDGTLQEYDALQEKAKGAQERLQELKETAHDPALKEIDISPAINFTASEITDVDELQGHIDELQSMIDSGDFTGESLEQLQIVLEACNAQMDYLTGKFDNVQLNFSLEGIKSGQQTIDNMVEKIKIINDLNANPEVNVKYNLEDDDEIVEWAKQIAGSGENVQLALGLKPTDDYKNIIEQISNLSTGKPVEMTGKFVGDEDFLRLTQANDIIELNYQGKLNEEPVLDEPITAPIEADPTSVEKTKTDVEQGISEAKPKIEFNDPIPLAWNGLSDHPVNIDVDANTTEAENKITAIENTQPEVDFNANANVSEVEEKIQTIENTQPEVDFGANTSTATTELEELRAQAEQMVQTPVQLVAENSEEDVVSQSDAGGVITYSLGIDSSEAESALETIRESGEQPIETPLTLKAQNTVQDAVNQAGGNQPAVVNQQTTTTETVNHVENYTANTSGLEEARNALTSLQSKSGSTVTVNVGVSGAEKITQTQTKLNQLLQKAKSKINVVVNGNHSGFLKSYNETISKLNEIAKKDTTAKIKGDNSNLKDKVSEAKSKLNSIDDKKVHITASATGFDTITTWKTNTYDKLKDKKITITTHYSTSGSKPTSPFNGSAHNQGTIMSNGHAYAGGTLSGNWGLPKAEKGALINELGSEIVVTPDGHWQILNSGDPTFVNLPKGAIIFNHKQTESLLKKGYINGSHGKIVGSAFVSGTADDEELEGEAFAVGTTRWSGALFGNAHGDKGKGKGIDYSNKSTGTTTKKKKSGGGGNGGGGGGGNHSNNNNKSSKDFLQTLDAIEIQLQRVDAELQRLETNANKTFESFTSRAKSFNSEIHTTKNEIKQLEKSIANTKIGVGAQGTPANYFRKARLASTAAGYKSGEEGANKSKKNMTGQPLTDFWINRIQNGVSKGALLTLNDVGDEGLWKKIQAYQTWYEKGIKLQQKRQEYLNKLNQLTIASLQLTQKKYESYINYLNESMNTNQQRIERKSSQPHTKKNNTITLLSQSISTDNTKKAQLKKERDALEHQLKQAVKNGYIKERSEEWYTWKNNIEKINGQIIAIENDIVAKTNQKLEYVQERWQMYLDNLDKLAENYKLNIESQKSKQKIGQTFDKKSKNADEYKPTTSTYDNVIKYYDDIDKNERSRKNGLQNERKELQQQIDDAIKNKRFEKNSQVHKKWLNELQDLDNQILESENNLVENVINKLEYIQDKWDAIVDHFETISDRFKEFADLQSAQGYEVSKKYYQQQISQTKSEIKARQQEVTDLQAQLDEAVKKGYIVKYSSEWYEWATHIEDVRNDIVGLQKDIVNLNNDIRQLDWDRFENAQDTIKNVINEMEFLSELIREDDLFDDKGKPTKDAQASAGLIAQQYDLLMKQANRYKDEVTTLNEKLAKDPYNKTLIKQRNEWLEAQQDSIKAAEKQKEAMVDLAEKGIKKQIEAMNELISKYEEALDKQRSQEQYAKSIADKQKSISNLEKQLRSMGGDDSEEGRVRRQQLRDQLKQAQQDLKDTQEDKRVSDIKEALKEMQDKYEEVLNDRLKNIDALFEEAINRINQNGASIVETIKSIGNSVNYTFSAELAKTYEGTKNTNKNDSNALVSNINSIGTFINNAATTLKTIGKITQDLDDAKAYSDEVAVNKINTVSTTTTTKKPTTTPKKKTTTPKKGSKTTTPKKKTTTPKKGGKTTTPKKTKKNNSTGSSKRENGKNAPAEFSRNPGKFNMSYKSKITTTKKPTSGLTLVTKPNTKNGSTAPLKNSNPVDLTKALTKAFTATTKKPTTTPKRTTTTSKKVKHGTYTENGKKVFYYNGVKKTGLFYGTDGKKRLVDSTTGTLVKGWRTIGGKSTYYFDSAGRAVTGLQKIDGKQYYFNEIAILKKGTFTVGNTTYTTDKNGRVLSKKSATAGHLAKGIANVKRSGMYEVDEHGEEVFINKNGRIYTRLDKGSTVLPHDAAVNLLKGMSDPLGFIASHMDLHPNNTTTTNNTGDTTNYITFNIPNVTNYSEFMREAQRDPNFTKYIQEISLGRLNGNNSLKGNSIRFR